MGRRCQKAGCYNMKINWNPITIQDALRLLQEWALADQAVTLSIHFARHVITHHTGQLHVAGVNHITLVSPYDQHVSVDAASYEDFFTGDTDGKLWVVMKPSGPAISRPPIVMFRLKTEGDDFLGLPAAAWTVN